ncbi:MAG: aspartate aminotransferase family protein, partial [Spirochaetia bacterium]|nr:aspartate aminotransferase family protein [Spirochaetia bacterium]
AGRAETFKNLAPDGPVYQAGTLSGNPVAMAAGLAQLKRLTPDVYARLEGLGQKLEQDFNARNLPWKMSRIASIFWIHKGERPDRADKIDREAMKEYAQIHRHCLERGVYLAPSGYEVGFISEPMEEADMRTLSETIASFFTK